MSPLKHRVEQVDDITKAVGPVEQSAVTRCPKCQGVLFVGLLGPRSHIQIKCRNERALTEDEIRKRVLADRRANPQHLRRKKVRCLHILSLYTPP